jgi:decaprenyl-phosphate phosphoribosyltransferase
MSQLKAYITLARPHQYVKNGFVWLPLFFGHKLGDLHAILNASAAFLLISFLASSVYIINDIRDRKEDREHPTKRNRPLASGDLPVPGALVFSLILFVASSSISLMALPGTFSLILASYFLLNMGYSFYIKRYAIIDVTCIAIGFVLRVVAGGVAAEVAVSPWIIMMTFLLAFMLALGKRRDDLLISADGHHTRKSLGGYNLEFVSLSMVTMTSVVIVAYILYCVSPEIIQKHGTNRLYLTSFWVILGLLRYLQISFVEARSGSPTLILLTDRFLWFVGVAWMLTFYWLIYESGN